MTLHALIHEKRTLDETSDDIFITDRQTCYQILLPVVKQKLILEGYFLNYKEVPLIDLQKYVPKVLIPESDFKCLILIHQALQTPNVNLEKLLKEKESFLIRNPEVLINSLLTTPNLWHSLPESSRTNPTLTDWLIQKINKHCSQSVAQGKTPPDTLFDCLWALAIAHPGSLKKLDLTTKLLVLKLIKQDGLLFIELPQALQEDPDIRQEAVKQNPFTIYFWNHLADYQTFKRTHSQAFSLPATPSSEALKKHQRLSLLLTAKALPLPLFLQLTQELSLAEIIYLLEQREEQQLASIPLINKQSLQKFSERLKSKIINFNDRSSNRPNELRITKDPSESYNGLLLFQALLESNHWLIAFIRFQKTSSSFLRSFNPIENYLLQLKISANRLVHDLKNATLHALDFWKEHIVAYGLQVTLTLAAYCLIKYLLSLTVSLALYCTPQLLLLSLAISTLFLSFLLVHMSALERVGTAMAGIHLFLLYFDTTALLQLALFSTTFFATCIFLTMTQVILPLLEMIIKKERSAELMLTLASLRNSPIFFLKEKMSFFREEMLLSPFNAIWTTFLLIHNTVDYAFNVALSLLRAILPLLTRSLITGFQTLLIRPFSKNEATLQLEVDRFIFLLLEDSQPLKRLKGELLAELWNHVLADRNTNTQLSLREALEKKYSVNLNGNLLEIAFNALKVKKDSFFARENNASNARSSFFHHSKNQLSDTVQHTLEPIPA